MRQDAEVAKPERYRQGERDQVRELQARHADPGRPRDVRRHEREVTRAIVDSHHGELEFECLSEGGTIATIWLPEANEGAARQAS